MGKRSTIPTTGAKQHPSRYPSRTSKLHSPSINYGQWSNQFYWRRWSAPLPVRLSSAQDAKVSVDLMGIGATSCAHWQSTPALRLEGTIWIYGFWTGLNYVAAASGQTETKVDTAAAMVEVKKTCAQRPSQVLASAVWTAYLDTQIRGRCARGKARSAPARGSSPAVPDGLV